MIHYTRHIVFFAAVTLSAAAQAQTGLPPEAPATPAGTSAAGEAVPPAETPPPAAPAPPPPVGIPPAEAARIDEADQAARIALRKHELLEEEAAKRAKEAPKVSADDKGFSIALPDKFFVLKIRARFGRGIESPGHP